MHSPNLVQYAAARGWCDVKEHFNFAEVYGNPSNQNASYNTDRYTMALPRLATSGKISLAKLMWLMRWEYEGTPMFKANPNTGSPFRTDVRTISCINTLVSSIAQLRSSMPRAEVRGALWINMSTAKTGVYIPWYCGTKEFSSPSLSALMNTVRTLPGGCSKNWPSWLMPITTK